MSTTSFADSLRLLLFVQAQSGFTRYPRRLYTELGGFNRTVECEGGVIDGETKCRFGEHWKGEEGLGM